MWDWLRGRHGDVADVLRGVVERRLYGDLSEDLYAIKNGDLQLSLDMGIGYSFELYRAQLERLVSLSAELPSPRRILDPGCENGLLTCFYGQVWPNAEVIGVDASPEAIARAVELCDRERIGNVSFQAVDPEGEAIGDLGEFDLMLASRTLLFERTGTPRFVPPMDVPTITPMPPEHAPEGWAYVSTLARALTGGGLLVSLERSGSPVVFPSWLAGLAAVDLGIDWEHSGWLCFDEVGVQHAEPLLILSHPATTESWDHTLEFLLARPAESTWPFYLWRSLEERVGPRSHAVGIQMVPFDGGAPQSIVVEHAKDHILWLTVHDGELARMETYPLAMNAVIEARIAEAVDQASSIGEVSTF